MMKVSVGLMAAVAVLVSVTYVAGAAALPEQRHATAGRVFRGNGGETLPPFLISGPSTLFWTNSGDIFQIFPSGGSVAGSVNAQSSRGWTYLPRGRYLLQINAIGNWTINVVVGIVRPHRLSAGYVGYTGNGGMNLPPFKAPRSEQLYWQATGSIFQIFSGGYSGVNVNSQAHRGSTFMSRGTQTLQINTTGNWLIGWKP